ncbi:hypothetical protein D3Z50_13675 [Clostridiaceae bacterium]|nr:hypothetical protein [Clostridiaceae bacterium]
MARDTEKTYEPAPVPIPLCLFTYSLLTIGMVNDMYVESRNDGCPEAYVELATQADFDNF